MPYKCPQKAKEAGKLYRERNKEKIRAKNKKYYRANKDKIKAYWAANQDKRRKCYGLPDPTHEYPDPEVCECCGGPPTGIGRLHLDHDHTSGIFRGWICSNCNLGIGLLGDTKEGVDNASKYLRRSL